MIVLRNRPSTFTELVQRNKEELLKNPQEMAKMEKKLDAKQILRTK
ncbi:FbpB family small basic protein [Sediminibacillus halophilus]|nr:FbpB family small basic protein [Sediminibacillus halophilus]